VLSKREIEVLDLIRTGLYQKEVAAKLNIKTATVKNHMFNIRAKLKAESTIEAIYKFYESKK